MTRTRKGSSSRPRTSASGPSICSPPPTARSTSSTCIAASCRTCSFRPSYLKDYIVKHELELPVGNGRIWRVVHDSTRPRPETGALEGDAGGARGAAVASQRLVARHGATAARAARRSIGGAGAETARAERAGSARQAARAVDARRPRCDRRRHRRTNPEARVARRPRRRRYACRSGGSDSRTIVCRRRCCSR